MFKAYLYKVSINKILQELIKGYKSKILKKTIHKKDAGILLVVVVAQKELAGSLVVFFFGSFLVLGLV